MLRIGNSHKSLDSLLMLAEIGVLISVSNNRMVRYLLIFWRFLSASSHVSLCLSLCRRRSAIRSQTRSPALQF